MTANRIVPPRSAPLLLLLLAPWAAALADPAAESPAATVVAIDARATGKPFPHFWEQMFGSGRAALSLRDDYRRDIRLMKKAADFRYVRAHAIFHDELGVYDEDEKGNATYNFSYVDQVYDGMLAEGVKPFVELSFMPMKLTSDPKGGMFPFWYKPNVAPPKDYARWDALIDAFARHLIERYGIEEVASWYFEVWNEPNIGFWGGNPQQSTYYELYDHTARALKQVDTRLRVGGPSTAQAAWVGDFIRHCKDANVPVDFVSSHVYANDLSQDVFHNDIPVPRDQMVCRAVRKVHEEILASPAPAMPLIFSEYNASFMNEPNVTDSIYMGPWLATTVAQCDGLIEAMSYWTFSDVFEEQGVTKTPFFGGFGAIAERNIPKPAYNAFAMLHRLGDTRLPVDSDSVLATRRPDGSLAIAVWNYAPPDGTGAQYTPPGHAAAPRRMELHIAGSRAGAQATIQRLDATHGNVLAAFDAMGRPPWPTRAQIARLRQAGSLPPADHATVRAGMLSIELPASGLALIVVK